MSTIVISALVGCALGILIKNEVHIRIYRRRDEEWARLLYAERQQVQIRDAALADMRVELTRLRLAQPEAMAREEGRDGR